jgi:hypothetical protein
MRYKANGGENFVGVLSSRVSDCLATPLALASSWKSKGAARRIVKDKAPDLSSPSKPTEKELTTAKNWEDSDAAKQRSPGLCRDKAEVAARSHKQLVSTLRPNLRISCSPTEENEGGLSCSARSC